MNIDEIFNNWKIDSTIDETDLAGVSLRTPKLHYKYLKMFTNEKMLLKKISADRDILKKNKIEYFSGNLDYDTLRENGWEPHQLKILRSDIPTYLNADSDMIKMNLKITLQQEKVDILESILRILNNRGFHIKNAIDFMKFQAGGY